MIVRGTKNYTKRSRRMLWASIVAALFVMSGLAFLSQSSAATNWAAAEPESGTVAAPAAVTTDQGASAGRAVKFSPAPPASTHPWKNTKLYVAADTNAARQAQAWAASRPADAAIMRRMAATPTAKWFGGWNVNITADVNAYVTPAASAGAIPVLVAYNIPGRDCGSYSAGGAANGAAYQAWINAFANGLNGRTAVVVIEPDALGQIADCLTPAQQTERYNLIKYAVATLQARGAIAYVDASHWIPAGTMAARLNNAGIASAAGFSINVSNFVSTAGMTQYGDSVSGLLSGKHYIIDTSRNGNGAAPGDAWCNPPGRAFGVQSTLTTNNPRVDAWYWVKMVGESDGTCNGGPAAGVWWPEYALQLGRNAGW